MDIAADGRLGQVFLRRRVHGRVFNARDAPRVPRFILFSIGLAASTIAAGTIVRWRHFWGGGSLCIQGSDLEIVDARGRVARFNLTDTDVLVTTDLVSSGHLELDIVGSGDCITLSDRLFPNRAAFDDIQSKFGHLAAGRTSRCEER